MCIRDSGSEVSMGDTRLAVQVFERYSMTGGTVSYTHLDVYKRQEQY